LYCGNKQIWYNPLLMQLDSVKSMILNAPAKGTAGFDRSFVNGDKRSPRPPAIIIVNTLLRISLSPSFGCERESCDLQKPKVNDSESGQVVKGCGILLNNGQFVVNGSEFSDDNGNVIPTAFSQCLLNHFLASLNNMLVAT